MGIRQMKILQITVQNNWDVEVAVRVVLYPTSNLPTKLILSTFPQQVQGSKISRSIPLQTSATEFNPHQADKMDKKPTLHNRYF